MKAVSLFSGVGGIDLGFERAGITTVLQAESDPHCLSVLAHHWPDVERVNDVRSVGVGSEEYHVEGESNNTEAGQPFSARRSGHVDIVYGGFPCQPFSVAGKRAGDRDDRNLWPEFRRIVSELRPRWVVAENVPGLLSIDGGRFFGSILADLGQLGFDGVAYAILDSQYFGVPQRRRRVFIVAGPRRRAVEQVLSLCESCGGHHATGGAAGQDVAFALAASVRGTGDGHGNAWNTTYAIRTAQTGSNGWGVSMDGQAYTLDGAHGQAVAAPLTASAGHHGHSSPRGDGADNLIASPLGAHHGRQDLDHDTYVLPDIAWALQERDAKGPDSSTKDGHLLPLLGGVRRLTPRECERLMGWPDDHTRWAADGREIADSHRYRMCGNGVVAPVAEWIGRRLIAIDAIGRGRA